jgi:hypothetical protein
MGCTQVFFFSGHTYIVLPIGTKTNCSDFSKKGDNQNASQEKEPENGISILILHVNEIVKHVILETPSI